MAVGTARAVLDASAGDDGLVYELAKDHCVVANDIDAAVLVRAGLGRSTVAMTQSDMTALPFRSRSFDVAIAKNSFHHLRDRAQQRLALAELTRVARRVVVVDIQDPSTSLLARAWNRWYRILGDDGEAFLTPEALQRLVTEQVPAELARFEAVGTVKGTYMIACIDQEVNGG
jgi:ubiquinone/menaquinone biosynthesis C-methylase UbiE